LETRSRLGIKAREYIFSSRQLKGAKHQANFVGTLPEERITRLFLERKDKIMNIHLSVGPLLALIAGIIILSHPSF